MKYTTILFDLDGTLLDTLQDITNSVNYALRESQLPERTLDEIKTYVGNGIRKLFVRALMVSAKECHKTIDDEAIDLALVLFRKHYMEHCKDCTKPYEGIMDLLQKLKALGYKMAIISNKPQREVSILHEKFFADYVDVAFGENEVEGIRRKPSPDMVLKALNELGEEVCESIYVGDSHIDVETAKNSGMNCISVLWGFRTEEFLKENGATILVKTPNEILQYV